MMQMFAAESPCLFQPGHRAADGVGRLREDGHAGLLSEHAQLLDGRRALQVGADEQGVAPLLLPPQGELGRVGRLPRALQAGHEDDGGGPRGIGELERLPAQDPDQLLVHRPDHLLARGEALRERLGADPQADAVAEPAGHREFDVGLEQRGADLPERLIEVGVADTPLTPQAGRDPLQTVREGIEHGVSG